MVFPQVFTDTVKYDDGIIQGLADDGQEGCNNRQGEFLIEN